MESQNQTRTDLVSPLERQSQSLAPWNDPATALKPATRDDFRRELTACLALCGAVGMTEDGRREWLIAAWGTLSGIPADLLERGCIEARKIADHPSKVIPAIMREVGQAWSWRRENHSSGRAVPERLPAPVPDQCTPEQAAAILAEFGLKRNPLDSIAQERDHETG